MGQLEQSFSAYMVEINALQPSDPTLAGINTPYAHTYILEDAYLNALVAALPDGDFSGLPNTQLEQRDAIIAWRVQLEIVARKLSVVLPPDLQQAAAIPAIDDRHTTRPCPRTCNRPAAARSRRRLPTRVNATLQR